MDPANTAQRDGRQRRRRLVLARTRAAARRRRSASAVDWQDLNGDRRPGHRRGPPSDAASRSPSSPASPTSRPSRPGCWGGTQDNGTAAQVGGSATAGSTWRAATAARSRRPDRRELRLRQLLRHLPVPQHRRRPRASSRTRSSRAGSTWPTGRTSTCPRVMNQGNPNQLFLGTYRLYRTDNAKARGRATSTGTPISPDLTSGCTGAAPNGARGCVISRDRRRAAATAVVYRVARGLRLLQPGRADEHTPTWTRVGRTSLPNRPVSDIAVDRSNYRIAYVAFNGFNAGTPKPPGSRLQDDRRRQALDEHQLEPPGFAGQLPPCSTRATRTRSTPARTSAPSSPTTAARAGQAARHAASRRSRSGSSPSTRRTGPARRHPRPWRVHDDRRGSVPALVRLARSTPASRSDPDALDYTISSRTSATPPRPGVALTDPIPGEHELHLRRRRRRPRPRKVKWTGKTVAAGDTLELHFRVTISGQPSRTRSTSIVDDGLKVTSTQGIGATGSAHLTPIAPAHAVRCRTGEPDRWRARRCLGDLSGPHHEPRLHRRHL